MAEDKIYLTLSRKRGKDGKFMATLSLGQPQFGDVKVIVLDVTTVNNMKEAKAWKKKHLETRPWERRH